VARRSGRGFGAKRLRGLPQSRAGQGPLNRRIRRSSGRVPRPPPRPARASTGIAVVRSVLPRPLLRGGVDGPIRGQIRRACRRVAQRLRRLPTHRRARNPAPNGLLPERKSRSHPPALPRHRHGTGALRGTHSARPGAFGKDGFPTARRGLLRPAEARRTLARPAGGRSLPPREQAAQRALRRMGSAPHRRPGLLPPVHPPPSDFGCVEEVGWQRPGPLGEALRGRSRGLRHDPDGRRRQRRRAEPLRFDRHALDARPANRPLPRRVLQATPRRCARPARRTTARGSHAVEATVRHGPPTLESVDRGRTRVPLARTSFGSPLRLDGLSERLSRTLREHPRTRHAFQHRNSASADRSQLRDQVWPIDASRRFAPRTSPHPPRVSAPKFGFGRPKPTSRPSLAD